MANTYQLISSNVLSTATASVTFSAIPATYTDLVILGTARSSVSGVSDVVQTEFNSNTSAIYSNTLVYANNATAGSIRSSNDAAARSVYYISGDTATSNTFGTFEIYIPSYTVSQNKPYSGFGVGENDSANERIGASAMLFRSTTAISSIKLTLLTGPNFMSGSSFYLYGIKNS